MGILGSWHSLMCGLKEFLIPHSGFLTPLIALLAGWIAYRQLKIQEYRVRLDLYEPRMKIYDPIMKLLTTVGQKGTATNEELVTFLRETSRAKFLFKGELEKHIDAIYKKGVDLHYIEAQLANKSLPDGPERTAFEKQKKEIDQWLGQQYNKTDELFAKYVKLDK
jgi:hypothetical protein